MPCRCDYMDDPPVQSKLNAEHEHTRACKAQSLVHKLALHIEKGGDELPPAIQKRVEATRTELLAHKRQELSDDVSKLEQEINLAMSNVVTISNLGGSPNQDLLEKIEKLRKAKAQAIQISDQELLGKE